MQAEIDIAFDELVKLAKKLPVKQWAKLKTEVETVLPLNTNRKELKKLLLNGPVATKQQIETIKNNRKAINQWRTK